jgi:hypothetical protein
LEKTNDLNNVYSEALKEFAKKTNAPTQGTAKDKREASSEMSAYIKNNFKPEADVLLPPDQAWSSFMTDSKQKAKERLRECLADTLTEFLDCSVLTADEFFQILLEAAYDNWQYFQKNSDQNKKLVEMLQKANQD